MDVNLTGQFWGMGSSLAGQLTQPWYATYSSVIAAALSAFLVFIITFIFHRRDRRNTINQRRQQAYSELRGGNDLIAEFYQSYAEAFLIFHIQRAIRARTGIPFEPLIIYQNERWMNRCDEYSKDVDIQYGRLLETLSLISFIFDNTGPLIHNVENLNRSFIRDTIRDLESRYRLRVSIKVALLSPPIPSLGIPIGSLLSPPDTERYLILENGIIKEITDDIRSEIGRHIREPVEKLLNFMFSQMVEAKAKHWYQFWK